MAKLRANILGEELTTAIGRMERKSYLYDWDNEKASEDRRTIIGTFKDLLRHKIVKVISRYNGKDYDPKFIVTGFKIEEI